MIRCRPIGKWLLVLWVLPAGPGALGADPPASRPARYVELPADVVRDKVHGGMLGQLFGNLNGLKYEFKFDAEPGNVEKYTPSLSEARTDDDTDIEWVYVVAMQRARRLRIPYDAVTKLWKAHINRSIWVANDFARALMEMGIDPPLTGSEFLNPKSHYNISGQFVCETFGLVAPGMPRTAARTGLHYTRVTIDGEPAQATQLFCAMIATAFLTDKLDEVLDAGLASVDPRSRIREIASTTRAWHGRHPKDWRATRRLIRDKYARYPGGGNGYGVITASTVASLLYGGGDLAETLRLAFNFGWDADNTAATAGTIVGVIQGRKWMRRQGWRIGEAYRNTTRDQMPADETISRFADRVVALAELAIVAEGGRVRAKDGRKVYRIRVQKPANVEPLVDPKARLEQYRTQLGGSIEADVTGENAARRIRAVVLAVGLGLGEGLCKRHPEAMKRAVAELRARLRADRAKKDAHGKRAEQLHRHLDGRLKKLQGLLAARREDGMAKSTQRAGWQKLEGNPVLGGKLGTCFDVAVLTEGDTYRMYFSWRPKGSVALVESADGIAWSDPRIVLAPNPKTGWEGRINRPAVLRRKDGYHLWYTGQSLKKSWIGYATSADGIAWKRSGDKPVLSPEAPWEKVAVMCPHVIWDARRKRFGMWYSGGDQYEPDAIGYATSPDGRRWTKHASNPVFRADKANAWEKHKVTACQVVRRGAWYTLFYIGFRDEHHAQIGLARSRDGIGGWQRHPANPILAPDAGAWDADACYKPFAVFDKRRKRWLLWYNGRRGSVEQIGLAFHEGEDLGWGAEGTARSP